VKTKQVNITGLRATHFEQLLNYLDHRDNMYGPWYHGNKEQFEKRHDDLKRWIAGILVEEFNKS
jgi:hypothetical protein